MLFTGCSVIVGNELAIRNRIESDLAPGVIFIWFELYPGPYGEVSDISQHPSSFLYRSCCDGHVVHEALVGDWRTPDKVTGSRLVSSSLLIWWSSSLLQRRGWRRSCILSLFYFETLPWCCVAWNCETDLEDFKVVLKQFLKPLQGFFPVFWEHDPYPWNWEFQRCFV